MTNHFLKCVGIYTYSLMEFYNKQLKFSLFTKGQGKGELVSGVKSSFPVNIIAVIGNKLD